MANSKEYLLQTMKGRANTLGWGAIVSFNRTKVNHLLAQQHIARFTTESFLPAIRGKISLEGNETVELSGLILSEPRLSFENASLSDAMARLHMDIVGGTVTHLDEPPGSPSRAISSFNISEQHGYWLEADIELRKVVGTINKKSEVVLNLSEATEFTSNLIESGISETLIGDFFQTQFDALPVEQQIYSLGILDLNEDDLLAPKDFYILTQAAPGGKDIKADTYGDGAVVLFVRTKNNLYNGILPEDDSGMPFFIPDDKIPGEDRSMYSGSLLLSRQAMFHWYIAPYISTHIGRGLSFEVKDDSEATGEYKLLATSGGFAVEPIDITWYDWPDHYHFIRENLSFSFRGVLFITITPDYRLALKWQNSVTEKFLFWDDVKNWWDERKHVDVRFNYSLNMLFDNILSSEENTLRFVQSPESTLTSEVTIIGGGGTHWPLLEKAKGELDLRLKMLLDTFKTIDIPEINFFAINHLLFPENNALILKEAYLPGDLALFGEIDPGLSSFSLKPLYTTVQTGAVLQFETVELRYRARAADITWNVRDIDGSRSKGDITQDGVYTAPSLGQLEDKTTRNIVTATYTDPDTQQKVTASAMVVIVASSMAMAPAMHAIDLRYSPAPFMFRVSSLTDSPITWTPLPDGLGTLTGTGQQATYMPPTLPPDGIFNPVTVEAVDTVTQQKCTGIVLLVNGVMPVDVQPAFHPGLAPLASLTLSNSSTSNAPQSLAWNVEVGDGSVDTTSGTFTAPEEITFPYSVVRCRDPGEFGTQSGYGVIHLSEVAPRAQWVKVVDFKIEEQSGSASLFANGLAQVMLKVSVQPLDENGQEVDLTASEKASLRLIFKDSLNDLPYVGESGIPDDAPADKQWAANKSDNGYRYYPPAAPAPLAANDNSVILYIQTRGTTPQLIAAALTRADYAEFNSTQDGGSEEKDNIIKITPVVPPSYTLDNFEFTKLPRVEGGDDDDYELNTTDYYTLRLKDGQQFVDFLSFEFEGHSSMVQWESRQYEEEMGSYTGFALSGSNTLQFETVVIQTIPLEFRPASTLLGGITVPQGGILLSLHRRMNFAYNNLIQSEFAKPVRLKLIDEFGNSHRITVQFKSPTNRNELTIVSD